MSRIAFRQTGWFDPNNPDWRCFFSYEFVNPLTPVAITGITFAEAFASAWKIRTWSYDFNFTVTPTFGIPETYTGSGTVFSQFVTDDDEWELVCNAFSSVRINDASVDMAIGLCNYDAGTELFSYGSGSNFSGGLNFDPATGPLTALNFSFMGHPATVYGDSGIISAIGDFSIDVDSFWEFSDGQSAAPGTQHGLIYDSVTGDQVLFPLPSGVA